MGYRVHKQKKHSAENNTTANSNDTKAYR